MFDVLIGVALTLALHATAVPSADTTPAAKAPAAAQQPPGDEEEAFDEQLRKFGYWSGAAYQCVSAEKQLEMDRQILDTHNGISRLFGTDRAFLFASAFGRGTGEAIDKTKCGEFLKRFEAATALRGGTR